MKNKWQRRFANLALQVASWSKDPDCKVGAVIVSPDKTAMTFGYNGLPRGIEDNFDDKRLMCHAEINAILNAHRDITGWALYCTKPPCINCAKAIIQAGITNIFVPKPYEPSKWYFDQVDALILLEKANIGVQYDN